MNMLGNVISLIGSDRLLIPKNTDLCCDLMREFLRREALWARRFSLTDEIPFADLSIAGPDTIHNNENADLIKQYARSTVERRSLLLMTNWYRWKAINPLAFVEQNLPDPYLPLYLLFKNGGEFSREHGVLFSMNETILIVSYSIQKADLNHPYIQLND
jgi:hypothetical protein